MALHMVDYECDCGHCLLDEWKHRSLQKLIVCVCGQTMKESIQSPGFRTDHTMTVQ